MLGIFIFCISLILIFFIALVITAKVEDSRHKKTGNTLSYDFFAHRLELKSRVSANRKVLKAEPIYQSDVNYEPAKYVYTGATVGGITTGGVHKTGDKYTTSVNQSGKFKIKYKSYEGPKDIDEIKLTPELIYQAQNNPFISKFLQGDRLVLEKPKDKRDDKLLSFMAERGDVLTAMKLDNQNKLSGELTKDDCIQVINWVSGKE